jgi:hypothetical protein
MSTPNLVLPLDPTGSASSNLIQNEVHSIGTVGTRAFPLNYGLFFRDSVVVKDLTSGLTLTKDVQYYPAEMDLDSSVAYGQQVDAVILIVDTTVSNQVSVTYQAVGGINSLNSVAAQAALAGLDLNDAPVTWDEVQAKQSVYPPAPHKHHADDVFGTEYLVSATDTLGKAITQGQGAAQEALLAYAQGVVAELQNYIATANAALQAHESDFTNPHQVSAHQIGSFTTTETVANIAGETTTRQAGDAAVEASLTAHINNGNNPHALTPAQVGGMTRAQSDAAMTAMQTALEATIAANESTQHAHIQNYNNPHQVTAAQIGTWTTPQIAAAVTAAANTLQSQVNTFQSALQAHTGNTNNPHGDTAANVGTWTYNTISTNIIVPFNSHANNAGNPHGDVYSNIVTSNVDGSGVYSATTMNNSINSAWTSLANQINSLNGTIQSHVTNYSNPHGDNVSNTGGAYTSGQLAYAISLLQGPGGSAANAINYLASVHN